MKEKPRRRAGAFCYWGITVGAACFCVLPLCAAHSFRRVPPDLSPSRIARSLQRNSRAPRQRHPGASQAYRQKRYKDLHARTRALLPAARATVYTSALQAASGMPRAVLIVWVGFRFCVRRWRSRRIKHFFDLPVYFPHPPFVLFGKVAP